MVLWIVIRSSRNSFVSYEFRSNVLYLAVSLVETVRVESGSREGRSAGPWPIPYVNVNHFAFTNL